MKYQKIKLAAPFGFPISKNCKRRVAKKWINRRKRNLLRRYRLFHDAPLDTLISACAGLNERTTDVIPSYKRIGKRAEILWDLDFEGPTNSCSFYHCGVGPAKTHKECLAYIKDVIKYWSKRKDPYKFVERYKSVQLNPDGTYIFPFRD